MNCDERVRLPRRRIFRPRIESLEERCCLSVAVSIVDDVLLIEGDGADNVVSISDDGQGNILASITSPEGDASAAGADIRAVKINAGAGADSVNYDLTAALTTARILLVHLGTGSDQARLDFSQGVAGAGLSVDLHGGHDADTLGFNVGELSNARFALFADLGFGDDVLTGVVSGNLADASRAVVAVVGNEGSDGIRVDATTVDIDASSGLAVYLDGWIGDDTLATTYRGELDGRLAIVASGGFGIDSVTVDASLAASSSGKLFALVKGGEGTDNLTLNVNEPIRDADYSGLAILYAAIDPGRGPDTITNTPNVKIRRPPRFIPFGR